MDNQYYYGWKPSPPDFRDRLYATPEKVLATLPARVDLTETASGAPFDPPWNQGVIGSCGPHTSTADIVFAALRQQKLPSVPMPSRLFVYWCTRNLMGTINQDSGVDNRSMLKALARYGWCDETLWPYQPNRFREQPPREAFDQAATRKIVEYLSVPQDLDQMRGCLAAGDPFIFGFSVYQSLESQAVATSGMIPMPRPGERQVGGHDVLIVGYDDATQMFKLRNSWGATWGRQGYGWIPYAYATNPRLASDFWTVRHSALPSPIPPPEPPVPPAPPVPPSPGKVFVDLKVPAGVIARVNGVVVG